MDDTILLVPYTVSKKRRLGFVASVLKSFTMDTIYGTCCISYYFCSYETVCPSCLVQFYIVSKIWKLDKISWTLSISLAQ